MDAWLQKSRGYLVLALVEAVLLGGFFLWRRPAPAPILIVEPSPRPTRTPAAIAVYVSGAVLRPGVYTLAEGSRVQDALMAAGGPASEADLADLNLALALQDGQRVHVPVQGEAPSRSSPIELSLVNLNTASAEELDALPGIGPVLAARIVADRAANGPYAEVEDLSRVPGIGPALLADLEPLVCVR